MRRYTAYTETKYTPLPAGEGVFGMFSPSPSLRGGGKLGSRAKKSRGACNADYLPGHWQPERLAVPLAGVLGAAKALQSWHAATASLAKRRASSVSRKNGLSFETAAFYSG
jgi:hypothetical protein